MPMDTDFYAWGNETNQNFGMPGTKAKTSSGVLGPKMASEHQIHKCGSLPLAFGCMHLGTSTCKPDPDHCNFASGGPASGIYLRQAMQFE